MICTPDVASSTSPYSGVSSLDYDDKVGGGRQLQSSSEMVVGAKRPVPQYASGLLSAVDEAWCNLSVLAKCTSHKELCAIAGARIAKELHKKGATTGTDAFESFKSCYERFKPSPNTLIDIPIPSQHSGVVDEPKRMPGVAVTTATAAAGDHGSSFKAQFELILKKVQWSPSAVTGTSRTSLPSSSSNLVGSARSATGAMKRPIGSVTCTAATVDLRYDVKRTRS